MFGRDRHEGSRRRAIELLGAELDRLRACAPAELREFAGSSPSERRRDGVMITTHVHTEHDRAMILVEAWQGRRVFGTGGFVMDPDGTTHTPD